VTSSVAVLEAATWVKISAYDKIMTENQKEKTWKPKTFLHKSQSNR